MKHVKPYLSPNSTDSIDLNDFKPGFNELIEKSVSFDSIKEEMEHLNRIESIIPEDLRIEMELDMLFNRRGRSLSEYNRQLSEELKMNQ